MPLHRLSAHPLHALLLCTTPQVYGYLRIRMTWDDAGKVKAKFLVKVRGRVYAGKVFQPWCLTLPKGTLHALDAKPCARG